MKIWGRVNSINVMKALWCADELGLDYERIDAGMAFGVVDTPEYGALNPNRRVPTLQDGDLTLWESNVLVRYLSRTYGYGGLCPDDPKQAALADQWMDWKHTTLVGDITFMFWGLIRGRKENQDPATLAAAATAAGANWKIIDAALEGRDYMLGNELTMADIPIGACAWRWANLDIDRPSLPNVEAWHARLQQRPAFQKRVMLPLT